MSRIPIKIQVENVGEVEAEFSRIYAPVTVEELARKLPIEGFVAKWENAVYITTEITRGAEKTVTRLSKGDIFFWPPGRILGIAVEDHQPRPQTVKVGKVVGDVEKVRNVASGARMRFLPR